MHATVIRHVEELKQRHITYETSLAQANAVILASSEVNAQLTHDLHCARNSHTSDVEESKQRHITHETCLAQANATILASSEVNAQLTHDLDCARSSHASDSTATVLDLQNKVALTNRSIETALAANVQLQDVMESMAVQHRQESSGMSTRVSTLEDELAVARQLVTSMDASSVLHHNAVQQMQVGISEVDDSMLHLERDIAVAITSIEAITHVHKQLHRASCVPSPSPLGRSFEDLYCKRELIYIADTLVEDVYCPKAKSAEICVAIRHDDDM